MKFIDEAVITVGSGRGGAGCTSFRRESKVPRGGPDGGDGGRGGDVIFRVDPRLRSLVDFKYKRQYKAANGRPGGPQNMTGASGNTCVIAVPPGTVIRDAETLEVYADLIDGEYVALKGGRGGKGNSHFKNSVNQAPTHSQPGEEGDRRTVQLQLKLLADVGLVGLPNAGKSTLISKISAARPKIANYPFTTLQPQLGVVRVDDGQSFVVADMPGLIEGAHKGVGLGLQFLKHIERTRVLVFVIDAGGCESLNPYEDFQKVTHELKSYDSQISESLKGTHEHHQPLSERPSMVVLNKVDLLSPEERSEIRKKFAENDLDVWPVSAATGEGIEELVYELAQKVEAE